MRRSHVSAIHAEGFAERSDQDVAGRCLRVFLGAASGPPECADTMRVIDNDDHVLGEVRVMPLRDGHHFVEWRVIPAHAEDAVGHDDDALRGIDARIAVGGLERAPLAVGLERRARLRGDHERGAGQAVPQRTTADTLYDRVVKGRESFWGAVYPLFMERDMTRDDLRVQKTTIVHDDGRSTEVVAGEAVAGQGTADDAPPPANAGSQGARPKPRPPRPPRRSPDLRCAQASVVGQRDSSDEIDHGVPGEQRWVGIPRRRGRPHPARRHDQAPLGRAAGRSAR